jgi:putative LPXTG-motif protein cell wall anchor domain protein
MKKLLATILALVMALSLCTSAWATGETGTGGNTGTTPAGTETGGTETGGTGGGETGSGENGGQATTCVAETGSKQYVTLQAAIDAAKRNATVKLLTDTEENVTISTSYLTLDLNGHTLNGGTEKGKPALTVTARVTVKDSSEGKTGTIMREDTAENSGVSSHYVIDIQGDGWLTFESGIVQNNSGNANGKGASLVRVGDDSVAKYPGLNIKGGTFTQDNFIVIKVDSGDLFLNGGTLNSTDSYAIEDWHRATIKGGTVNGAVAAWTYNGGHNSDLTISGGTVNGNVLSVNYGSAEGKVAKVSITGGTVNGTLGTYTYNNGLATTTDTAKATIAVTDGTFSSDPTEYVVEDSGVTKNADGTFGVAKAYLAMVGDTSYYTMDEAFKAQTASGKPIVLLRDYTTGSTFNSGSINRTVDLNGHTWTCTGTDANSAAFEINYANASLTVKNGKIVSSQLVGLIPSASGGTITYDNSSLTFEGVEMSTTATSGIETNGNNTNDSVTLKNSTLNVPNGFGIYFPSSGTLTIDNSTINTKTMGVQVCAGSLEITGESAINVTGDAVPKTENDGAIQDGAAISVVDRAGYKGLGKVEVKNGSFTAKNDEGLKAYKYENKTEKPFENNGDKLTVTGGAFSNDVKDYVAADLTTANITTSGETTYYVGKETVEAAAAKAPSGSTVTVTQGDAELKNVPSGVTVKNTNTGNVTVNGGTKVTKDNENGYTVPRSYYYYPSTPGITAELNGTNKSATDYPGGAYGLVFRSTAAFSTFQGVQVDGKTLAKSNYTAEEGSTVVYLKAAYLKTLAAGKHTITILSTAGNTSMDFTIGGKTSPKTFDAGVGIYAVTAVLSVTGMAWTAKKRH